MDHSAVAMTLDSRTRLRTGTRTSDVVMVFWRYSLVMHSTPTIGARISMPKKPAPSRRRRWLMEETK